MPICTSEEEKTTRMLEVLAGLGPWVVGVLALIQPWVIAGWKRFVRKGLIDIYETGYIEVGYSSMGPLIGLLGTLRAIHHDQFVRSIDVTVTKVKDGAHHQFEWSMFRDLKLTIGGGPIASFEMPSGFLLMATQPRRYNILFSDSNVQVEIQNKIQALKQAWGSFQWEATRKNPSIQSDQQWQSNLFVEFSKEPSCPVTSNELQRLCWWDAGQYNVQITIQTVRPDRSFKRNWSFELPESDSQRLRMGNVFTMVREACQQQPWQYTLAYVKYEACKTQSAASISNARRIPLLKGPR